ncbi:serine/threonine-protein kinase GRIK2-like [Olea europaea var. sylvestris]|uniref:serine/threonine-protein kinase GRIK2-like n=1 Tax=Olea europaea var. sylvestris TaxID=158386 RepID=UPI000C1CF2D9|nr:serine/threonine-protein kinase GRIK2-like [Olea europaea var. sylvestris]
MGCCGCFGFSFMRKPKKVMMPGRGLGNHASQESLLAEAVEDEEGPFYNGDDCEFRSPIKRSEEILMYRMQHGLICREYPVKETHNLIRSEVNCRINVVLSLHHYHLEIFSHEKYTPLLNQGKKRKKIKKITSKAINQMLKYIYTFRILYFCLFLFVIKNIYSVPLFGRTRVVMYEEARKKAGPTLSLECPHPDQVITSIKFASFGTPQGTCGSFSHGQCSSKQALPAIQKACIGSRSCRIGVSINKFGDPCKGVTKSLAVEASCSCIVSAIKQNIVHGDIKPDNLLVTGNGTVKIGDFSVSQVFEDGNDELRRSPGTPVFTAPECCLGLTYHGKAADTWAVGVTLYCMVLGKYPFLGETLQDTYDKIVNNPLLLPDEMNPLLKNLIEGLLCKDPLLRMTLEDVAQHSWVIGEEGPIPQFLCWCKRVKLHGAESGGTGTDNLAYNN